MKVGVDSVLLGAWTSVSETGFALDIGAGTGILSLMLAQRSNLMIHAVEINPEACIDAATNFVNSPWNSRLVLHNQSIQDFLQEVTFSFSLIISNPPYFSQSLKSMHAGRNLSRHDDTLSEFDLLRAVSQLLNDDGIFTLILPASKADAFILKASLHQLYLARRLDIYPTAAKPSNRSILEFSRHKVSVLPQQMTVHDAGSYTIEYQNLTKDFYL